MSVAMRQARDPFAADAEAGYSSATGGRDSAMPIVLGAIADDFTGATDLCNTLVRQGMKTVQLIDVPEGNAPAPDAEAVVIALKSRTIPVAYAVELSLNALAWLRQAGARQIIFKY